MDLTLLGALLIVVASLVLVAGLINLRYSLSFMGIKGSKSGGLIVVGVMLASIGVIFGIVGHKASTEAARQAAQAADVAPRAPAVPVAPTQPRSPGAPLPADQTRFIAIVEQTRAAYRSSTGQTNDGGWRSDRAAKLCAAFADPAVRDWTGTLRYQTVNKDGRGELQVTIAPMLALSTGKNAASNPADRPLLEPGSDVLRAVAALKVGDRVVFSGAFIPDKDDCFVSIGLSGTATSPDFLFRFTSIRKK